MTEIGLAGPRLGNDEVSHRFRLFDFGCEFADLFEAIRPLIKRNADRVAEVFWDAMSRNPTVAAHLADQNLPQLVSDTADGLRSQFVSSLDAAWCERISRHGDFCYDLEVPGRAAVAAIAEAYDILVAAMTEPDSEIDAARWLPVFARMAALEHELVLTRINERQKRDEEARIRELGRRFEQRLSTAVDAAAALSSEVGGQSRSAAISSRQLLIDSQDVSTAARQCSDAMRNAAREAGQMLQRVELVVQQLDEGNRATIAARAEAEGSSEVVGELKAAARSIEGFTTIIRSLTEQTRMLALNALIEATHAGDAGRGFAVVAGEVKALAAQADKASGEVVSQVALVTSAVTRNAEGSEALSGTIGHASAMVSDANSEMELQREAITSISASVDETALAVENVSQLMTRIYEIAQATERDMAAADASLEDVRESLAVLQSEARAFLSDLEKENSHGS